MGPFFTNEATWGMTMKKQLDAQVKTGKAKKEIVTKEQEIVRRD